MRHQTPTSTLPLIATTWREYIIVARLPYVILIHEPTSLSTEDAVRRGCTPDPPTRPPSKLSPEHNPAFESSDWEDPQDTVFVSIRQKLAGVKMRKCYALEVSLGRQERVAGDDDL